MTKADLYKTNGMDKYVWGDSFELDISGEDISTEGKILDLLDQVCIAEKRQPLQDKWRKISFADCCILLNNAFHYDLAYSKSELMTQDQATHYQELLTSKIIQTGCHCYTNWNTNPWLDMTNGAGWDPTTDNTFDMAIIMLDRDKLIFSLFISED